MRLETLEFDGIEDVDVTVGRIEELFDNLHESAGLQEDDGDVKAVQGYAVRLIVQLNDIRLKLPRLSDVQTYLQLSAQKQCLADALAIISSGLASRDHIRLIKGYQNARRLFANDSKRRYCTD